MFPSNRKFSSGRFTNSGFQPTYKSDVVTGKMYSKSSHSSITYLIGIFVVLLIVLSLLYFNVPEFKYVVDLFI